jgi:hypothetical protein
MRNQKYISREKNRHGTEMIYFRKNGRRIRLRSMPGSAEFDWEVQQACEAVKHPANPINNKDGSFVYFILSGDKVKIGTARDPRSRFQQIRAGIPGRARVYYVTPGDRLLEQGLHKKFAEDRLSGEWFVYSKPIRDWIAADEERRIKERSCK